MKDTRKPVPIVAMLFRLMDEENAAYWADRRAFDDEMEALRKKYRDDET